MESKEIYSEFEKEFPDHKERRRFYTSAAFRYDMETYKELGTRFCRQCGRRSDLYVYCTGCSKCEVCQYPKAKCRCEDLRFLKHLKEVLEEHKKYVQDRNR